MSKSTADCKKFLSDYFKNNVSKISKDYSGVFDTQELMKLGIKHSEWIREWKSKPTGRDMDWYSSATGFWTTQGEKTFNEIASVRCFVLAPADFDSMVRYLVIEDKDGNLYIGEALGE